MQSPEAEDGSSEALLKQALRLGSDTAAVELARLSFRRRDWSAFHGYADEALRLNPGLGYVHMLRAYGLASERMPGDRAAAEKIIRECRRAVAVDPASGHLWLRYAELAFRISRHLSSRDGGERAAARYRQESLGAYGRALRLGKAGSPEALEDLLAAGGDASFIVAAFRGASPAALRRVAAVLLDRGEWEALGGEYLGGAADGAGKRDAYRAAAEELRSRKLYAEALEMLRGYPFAMPEDAYLAYLAALSAEALGPRSELWSEAGNYYREALRLDGTKTAYRIRLGVFLVRGGDFGGAEAALRQATEEDRDNAQAWFYLGRALEGGERKEEALAFYRKALALKPDHGSYRRALDALEEKIRRSNF